MVHASHSYKSELRLPCLRNHQLFWTPNFLSFEAVVPPDIKRFLLTTSTDSGAKWDQDTVTRTGLSDAASQLLW